MCPGKLLTCPLKRFPFTIRTSNETVIIPNIVLLKPHIFYDLDRQPSKIRNSQTINSSPYEKFRKILKRLFVEPIQNGSVLSHHVTKTKVFVCFDSFVIALLMKAIFRIVDFHDYTFERYMAFPKQNTLYHLTLTPFRHGKRHKI